MTVTVLIADDHAIVRDGLAALLQAQPDIRVVATAANGRDAVSEALRCSPDVTILDISMPHLDGLEAARSIRAERPDATIIFLSMYSSSQHVFHAFEAGARGYLLKESAANEIIQAVRAVHSGRRYVSSKVAEIMAEGFNERGDASPIDSLSRREREILKLVADGHSSARIGTMLHLSSKTVDSYRSRLMQKLHVGDLASLIKFAILHGLTSLD